LEKETVKSSAGVFLNRTSLTAVISILSFIAGVAYTKAHRPIPLLNAPAAETETYAQPLLNESEIEAEPKQPAPANTMNALASPLQSKAGEGHNSEQNRKQSSEWRTVRMRVTGYCPCSKCCGQYSDGITASGHKIKPGDTFVAADKRYSFGTEMVISGYSNGRPVKVLDRGGAIRGNRLDAFFHSHQEALQWGVRHIDVRVRNK
jgi:3D (Asp-Asp-Asp) domain-containing protein